MGNVLDGTAGDNSLDDNKWINTPNSVLFNDAFISSVYDNLPKVDGTEIKSSSDQVMNNSD